VKVVGYPGSEPTGIANPFLVNPMGAAAGAFLHVLTLSAPRAERPGANLLVSAFDQFRPLVNTIADLAPFHASSCDSGRESCG
jgi:hypothetical protein